MKNTDFLNLELPEREDKINVGVLTSDFEIIEDIIKQHAVVETMELDGVGAITGAIGPYIRLQNISEQQVTVDIGDETIVLESGENKIIRETAQNIGLITSGNVHITYFTNAKTYADKNFYDKKKVDELIDGIGTPEDVYTKTETDNLLSTKANKSNTYTKTETDNKITEKVSEIVAGAPDDFNTLKEMSDWLTEHEDSAAAMNTAIQQNKTDISTANTNIQKNVDDITAIKDLLNVKKYGRSCFTKDSTQEELLPRDEMYIKENSFGWSFNLYVTYISKIPANTRTVIGTISPPPPRPLEKRNVKIHANDMTEKITEDAVVGISASGEVYIITPVAVRENGATGHYGRINDNACVFDALKFDTTTTTEGGE